MLNFILGRAGTGKSQTVLEKIEQSVKENKSTYLIVPEQFTFESERKYLKKLGAKGLSKLKIISFSRLALNIFKEFGGVARDYADKSKKLCLMSMALHQISDELELYQKVALNPNFCESVLVVVDELKHAGMEENSLSEKIDLMDEGVLKQKTKDISLIFDTYNALLSQNYKDSLDDITRAIEKIKGKNFFGDCNIFIDEFKGFTQTELNFIEVMLKEASEVYVSLCMDKEILSAVNTQSNVFYTVYQTYNQIKQIARKVGVKISAHGSENSPVLVGAKRFESDVLEHMEQNLFEFAPKKYKGKAQTMDDIKNSCRCVLAQNEYDEIDYVCLQIRSIVQAGGVKYKDINVVSRDLSDYSAYLQTAFEKHDIPYFMDELKSVRDNPLIKAVEYLFDAVNGIDSNTLISWFKCGLSEFSSEQIAELENYVYLWDIKGSQWSEEFSYCTQGLRSIENPEDEIKEEAKLTMLNQMRENIITPLNAFKAVDNMATATEYARALSEFLEATKVRECLSEAILKLENLDESENANEKVLAERLVIAQEYKKSWEIIEAVVNILIEVLKDTVISRKRYFEMFNLVLSNFDIGEIPQSLDCVVVGSAERIRTDDTKIAFIIGANDKVFPLMPTASGIYSDTERQTLIENGVALSTPLKDKIREEKFIAYKTMTMASDKLFILARLSDLKGHVKTPSHIITSIKSMFGEDVVEQTVDMDKINYCKTKETAFSVLANNYRHDTDLVATLKRYFEDFPEYKSKMENIEMMLTKGKFELKDHKTTYELFGQRAFMSPSRVELFHKCKFMYFCDYGLRLKKREQVKMNAINRGLVIHDVLYSVCTKIGEYSKYEDVDKVKLKQIIAECLEEYVTKNLYGYDKQNKRLRYLYNRIKNTVYSIMERFLEEMKQSKFKPLDFEYNIGIGGNTPPYTIKTDKGIEVNLVGVVDRIDIYKTKNHNYIRVVDYKSGTKSFKLSDIVNGVNLQMFLYLMCLQKNGVGSYKNSTGAGVLYMPASDVSARLDRNSTEGQVHSASAKHYKMQGVVLSEEDVLLAMEEKLKGEFVPINLKANAYDKEKNIKDDVFVGGQLDEEYLYSTSQEYLLNATQMGKMFKSIENTIEKMVDTLYSGDIEARALKGANQDPCKFCSYTNVCQNSETDEFTPYMDLKKEEIMAYIDKTDDENNSEEVE